MIVNRMHYQLHSVNNAITYDDYHLLMVITQFVLNVFKRKSSFKELLFTRCLTSSTDFIRFSA